MRVLAALLFGYLTCLDSLAHAAEASSAHGGFKITYPDSWVSSLDGSQGTGVTVATSHSAILGHAAGINGGEAAISVVPLLRGKNEQTERERFESYANPIPVFTPGSDSVPGRIETIREGIAEVVLYQHIGGVMYAVSLQYNDGDSQAAAFRRVQAEIGASIVPTAK